MSWRVYTKIKYPEIRVLLRDFVDPAVVKSGLPTEMMLSEAPERAEAYKRYPVVLDDPAAGNTCRLWLITVTATRILTNLPA